MRCYLTLLALLFAGLLLGQNTRLAQQYYQDGEYEKAAQLYLELSKSNRNTDYFFDRYVSSLLALEDYDTAEAAIKKKLKKSPQSMKLYVTYGKLLEQKFEPEAAEQQYQKAIAQLPGDQFQITQLANSFIQQTKYEYAIATYERGGELLGDAELFAYNLGDLYRRKGDTDLMIENYLRSIVANPKRAKQVKTIFQRYLDKAGLVEAQKQLYARIQEGDDRDPTFPELLAWVFIQRKDYGAALRQARALDKRLDENGIRVFRLGQLAANDKDYKTAIKAFDYVVEEKGTAGSLYLEAKREGLVTRRKALTDGYDYTPEDLQILEEAYENFLGEFGENPASAGIVIQLAELEALYLNDLPKAIGLLDGLLKMPGVAAVSTARAKLALADYYLMTGDIWEATLLYSQVDKAFKEDLLGHEARFRNARLSYFRGDFQWAQSQFDVLKASTSKLIANDALDLSVFIIDNLGLDTSALALQTYADAELLVFQNRFDEAFTKMDSLMEVFPGHELEDDVVYLKADIHVRKREYDQAVAAYQKIIADYPESIRLDNSLYALAGLYEKQLDNPSRAQELYETLFIDYSNSILAVEARKKYRELRGDAVQ
ncbi:MAG: tetratricopeptide repeat protein [Bacteroidota bacterium]